jgi:hypothetical protein
MATEKHPFPSILLANDLLSGLIVTWTGKAWSGAIKDAFVAVDADAALALHNAGQAAYKRHEVLDVGLVAVAIGADGVPVPTHFRERFRTLGPTVRADLGKQAEKPQAGF